MSGQTIHIRQLSKKYGSVQAVDNLSFTVSPGRVTGFLGPNGAGKTTTLRMLLGLVRPTAGTATFGETNYVDIEEPMHTIGSHLSSDGFNPGRSGRNHLRVMAAQGGLDPSAIDGLLSLVDLSADADRRVGEYSLGMRQRLGLASALLGDPSVLILDEPANGLDPEGITWLRRFLRAFAEDGRTVFLSSHLLGEVQQMAEDVVIIDRGQLVVAGSVKELESAGASVVLVDALDRDLLVKALELAGLTVEAPASGPLEVQGTTGVQIGEIALVAGIPLTHLSEATTGLEDLFLQLVGSHG